jgi:methionine biosynthesis protein MetW
VSTAKYVDNSLRFDLQVIASWIEPGSKVLDLGCGEGELLQFLIEEKQAIGTGIELLEGKVAQCIEKGLSVLQGDISEEIFDYPDNMFDYVILSQTLQQVYEPSKLIQSMLKVGKRGVVSFPNFSQWTCRLQHLFTGHAPKTKQLPYNWYDTPNIRVISIRDFRDFVREADLTIEKEAAINAHSQDRRGSIIHFLPNWRATYGIYLIGSGGGA